MLKTWLMSADCAVLLAVSASTPAYGYGGYHRGYTSVSASGGVKHSGSTSFSGRYGGSVSHSGSYNDGSYSRSTSATGPGGATYDRSSSGSVGGGGYNRNVSSSGTGAYGG